MSTPPRRPTTAREPWTRQPLIVLSGLAGGWGEVTELLDLARVAVDADEAALLLLDTGGTTLVRVASSGLDDPTHGFRVPVGAGFAGQVAATGQPVLLTDVNPDTVLNPALHQQGIQSLLGVPVPGRPGRLGVVHVGSMTPRQFSAEDIARLQEIAAQLSVEVLRRRANEEHVAALALQRSLLPAITTNVEGLDIAARYIPADSELGGDWYDVFRLPDDRIGIVMGDVAGHGLTAAVVMGRLRSALRAYALEHTSPAEVLRLLDTKISYFEAGAVATVLYAVAEPPYACFTISSAGHLAPYLVTADGSAEATDVAPDPPLGIRAPSPGSWSRRITDVAVAPGAALCLFTDGLVERRPAAGSDDLDQIDDGLDRLLLALCAGTADDICSSVLSELVGEDVTEDDIALLVVRRLPIGLPHP